MHSCIQALILRIPTETPKEVTSDRLARMKSIRPAGQRADGATQLFSMYTIPSDFVASYSLLVFL